MAGTVLFLGAGATKSAQGLLTNEILPRLWSARATLQADVLIAQLLVCGAHGLILSHQRLNQVQQVPDHLPRGRVGNRIKVDIRNLHTGITMRARP